MSALGHVWTAPWQELSDVAAAFGRVRSRVRPVCAADLAAGPHALRGSGPNRKHALYSALTQTGSPDPRNDRFCITSSCPRQLVLPIDRLTFSRCQQQLRLLVSLTTDHDGPGHPRHLVG